MWMGGFYGQIWTLSFRILGYIHTWYYRVLWCSVPYAIGRPELQDIHSCDSERGPPVTQLEFDRH